MDFGLLGPLEVRADGTALSLGAAKQRALLAVLLINRNRVVSNDRLIDEVWGDEPPETAANVLHVYVSQLRKVLEPGRAAGSPGSVISTQAPGYVLRVDPAEVDADRFTRLADDGRTSLAGGDAERAARLLREALALWRGDALADFTYAPFAQSEIARLEELRVAAAEEVVEAELLLGRHAELVGELETLIGRNPLRERLRGQLILALYRSGRQAEALEAYQETRRVLVDGLGIEPSPSLQQLERRILVQDPELELPARPDSAPSPLPQAPQERAADTPPALELVTEARKTVTIVFSDLVGWTSLSERLDPEVVRRVMSRYFETASSVLVRHGGTVEKFIGDAVVAVFGVPRLHEDDALRAVRAVTEIRREIEVLNDELEQTWGARLSVRTGVNTGEVIAGGDGAAESALGGPVNVAARLEQAAAPGEILIGEETWRLVRDAVVAEPVEELALKGLEAAVRAWRLVDVLPDAVGFSRRLDVTLVGRELELAQLLQAFERAVRESRSYLLTVLGAAGIGKSRLASELGLALGDRATVLTGRCLPYGDGITFWPIGEIVREAFDDDSHAGVVELVGAEEGERVAELVDAVIGRGTADGAGPETFWAVRTVLAELAARRPLVVVFEDVHWAEPTLLDLIDHLSEWTRAPLLVLCLARPEFLDDRPGWGGGRVNCATTLLEPLSPSESELLIDSFAGRAELAPRSRAALARAAEGNPLFLEQMLALLAEGSHANAESEIPPTIQALLAARLDRLGPAERAVVEAAAVVGREFWREAVEDVVAPEARESVAAHLRALSRRELVQPERSQLAGQDGYRFNHILIRDVAYRGISKENRATLHERFAAWLERTAPERSSEFEEILGYHLEQAFAYRSELGSVGGADRELAARAGSLLASSGRRALSRGDMSSALTLLGRALPLLRDDDPGRGELALELAHALSAVGEIPRAKAVLEELGERAAAGGDRRLSTLVGLEQLLLETLIDPAFDTHALLEAASAAIAVFEELGDDQGLAKAWLAVAEVHLTTCRWGLSAEALERALPHASKAGTQELVLVLTHLANSVYWGPTPVPDAIRRCEEILELGSGHLIVEANVLCYLGGFLAMQGRFDESKEQLTRGRSVFEELGHSYGVAASTLVAGPARLLAGEAVEAEQLLRAAWTTLEAMGETAILSSVTAFLAESLYAQGRFDEVEETTRISEAAAADDDEASQIGWRATRAKALARRSELEVAERLARSAVERAEETDFLNMHGDALLSLATVLAAAGRVDEAESLAARAVELYELKGNAAAARRARSDFTFAQAPGTTSG